MLPRNNAALWICVFCLLGLCSSWALVFDDQPQNRTAAQKIQPTPLPADVDPSDPAVPVWMRPANVPSKGETAPPPTAPTGTGPVGEVTKSGSGYSMRLQTNEVILPVTVVDQKRHLVTTLNQNDFVVYEDDQPQRIVNFRKDDVPVSIGILVDNSGSMREKRAAVTKAVLNLVRASNQQDEAFIVNFNDEPYLDQDFTSNINLMREALDRLDSRGGTALYEAVIAAADHLAKLGRRDKKVLLVITDGEDNESRQTLEEAIRSVQNENGPTIYTIGILGSEGKERRAKRALEALSLQTGGVAFFPRNLDEVDEVSQQVAKDIRNQYTITYKPSNPQSTGGYRRVRVVARASGYKDLQVRTKSGYFAGQQKTASVR